MNVLKSSIDHTSKKSKSLYQLPAIVAEVSTIAAEIRMQATTEGGSDTLLSTTTDQLGLSLSDILAKQDGVEDSILSMASGTRENKESLTAVQRDNAQAIRLAVHFRRIIESVSSNQARILDHLHLIYDQMDEASTKAIRKATGRFSALEKPLHLAFGDPKACQKSHTMSKR